MLRKNTARSNFGGGLVLVIRTLLHTSRILSVFFTNWNKEMPRKKGQSAIKEDAKLDAKARAVRLQKDLEIQLETTRDPAEQRIIEARIENLKQLIRTITNIK